MIQRNGHVAFSLVSSESPAQGHQRPTRYSKQTDHHVPYRGPHNLALMAQSMFLEYVCKPTHKYTINRKLQSDKMCNRDNL